MAAVAGVPAAAQAAGAQSASGDITSPQVHLNFHAQRAAGNASTRATGFAQGQLHGLPGGADLVRIQGPVTCLDVRGNSVGLFYPFSSITPAIMGKLMKGIYVTYTTDGRGHVNKLTYVPSTKASTSSCAPSAAVLPASGTEHHTGG